MIVMRKCLTLFCLFCQMLTGFAQQTGRILGVIRDAETNETLIGVSIYAEQLQ